MWAHSFNNTKPKDTSQHQHGAEHQLNHLASCGCTLPWSQQLQQKDAQPAKPAPSPQKSSQPRSAQSGGGRYPRWAGSSDKSDVRGSSPPTSVKQDQVCCHLATRFINVNLYLSLLLFFQGLFMVQSCRQYRSFLHSPPPSYLWQSVTLERSNLREEIHWRWK